jgi:hypothetical protein
LKLKKATGPRNLLWSLLLDAFTEGMYRKPSNITRKENIQLYVSKTTKDIVNRVVSNRRKKVDAGTAESG